MAVHVHRAHRTDALADELARLLATPPDDPFAQEVVVVPARGVERWLTQRLSHRLGSAPGKDDGVCAGVRFLSPRSLVALLTGTEQHDPWDPDRLVWPLLATLDEVIDEPWATTLARHLGHVPMAPGETDPALQQRRDRRYSLARRLAGLLSAYAVQRPSMLAAWRAGQDTDGHGQALDGDLLWQPELYRRLSDRLDVPAPDVRHADVLARIRAGQPLALPDRLSLFGHTRLPVTEVELLAAVGEVREVHLWLPQASAALWDRLRDEVADGPVLRGRDRTALAVPHPLLASLGRDARELQRSLAALGPATDTSIDAADPPEVTPTLLGWLQEDLRSAGEPDARQRAARVMSATDTSVQLHACHGPARQVEVLREVLVGLLADDPTLEPRDILVMCPDIEAYAPLFEAGFGLAEVVHGGHPAHGLRVRLADRGLARTNPLLDLASRVVEIAGGRATASEILDLAGTEVVRRRFGLSDDDLEQIAQWVADSGARWGLAADLRGPFALGDYPHNTWRVALDRLLLGVGMTEQGDRFSTTLPLDGVESAAIDLAGRLAELIDRLETAVRALGAATTASEWISALREAIEALGDVPGDRAWQRAEADRELSDVDDAASGLDVGLRLADMRTLLEHRLQGRATRANFRTGALTVATMVPMRSVPHRVIALVGLDDGAYPRLASIDGDDALARSPRTGERDIRAEDRQLLLDAVLAATERLVLTYTGADEVKGEDRPPAVPIGELLDALDVTTSAPVRDRVVVSHPLQPFDARNFTPGRLAATPSEPFSFDRAALSGALAAHGPRRPVAPFLTSALPPEEVDDDAAASLTLADLQAFFAHPVRSFVRGRLDVALPWDEDELSDAIPVELDNLQTWAVGNRVLSRVLGGEHLDVVETAERSRGALPPFALGKAILDDVHDAVVDLLRVSEASRALPAETVDVTLDLTTDGERTDVTGQVPDVRGDVIVRVSYSRLGAKARLAAWIDLLALTVALPGRPWQAEVYGKGGRRSGPSRSVLGPVDPENARHFLGELIDTYRRGRCEPLPLPIKTAATWAQTPGDDWSRARAAYSDWHDGNFAGEQSDHYHELVWGKGLPLRPDTGLPVEKQRGLLLDLAGEGETWNGQSTRLGQYALRVWQPVLDHEQVGPA